MGQLNQMRNAHELEEGLHTYSKHGVNWEQWGKLISKERLADGTWLLRFEHGPIHIDGFDRRFTQLEDEGAFSTKHDV